MSIGAEICPAQVHYSGSEICTICLSIWQWDQSYLFAISIRYSSADHDLRECIAWGVNHMRVICRSTFSCVLTPTLVLWRRRKKPLGSGLRRKRKCLSRGLSWEPKLPLGLVCVTFRLCAIVRQTKCIVRCLHTDNSPAQLGFCLTGTSPIPSKTQNKSCRLLRCFGTYTSLCIPSYANILWLCSKTNVV